MAYWLFQGNPKYYRILDGIRDFDEMPWLVTRYAKEIAPGDGVLVWMAGKEAGIYAIAEVIEPAKPREELSDKDYWIDPKRAEGKLQAKIRFLRKLLGQPLRRHELKHDAILKDLLVIRAPNSTNFRVTPEQWERACAIKS